MKDTALRKLRIKGGKPLSGTIQVSGSKNASLPLMILSLLTDQPLYLKNVPQLTDVKVLLDLLMHLGVQISFDALGHVTRLQAPDILSTLAPYDIVSQMRASFWVLGPLLAREGEARVSLPGGCAIGARPVDIYIMGLQAMGVSIHLENGYIVAQAPSGLRGCSFHLRYPSVGATHVLMMAGALAQGVSVLKNVAQEPEVLDVGQCLITMGARITGLGTSVLTIEGVSRLHGAHHTVIPDRIEACTYAMAAAMTQGTIILTHVPVASLEIPLRYLERAGVTIDYLGKDCLRISRPGLLKAIDVKTEHYPGFPTDLQAQFMAMMTLAQGSSRIEERIFENRFLHVQELARLGADITLHGDCALVHGVPSLKSAPVMASDLRASAALVLAGLAAQGETVMHRLYHLERGFERLEEKLQDCGADISSCPTDESII